MISAPDLVGRIVKALELADPELRELHHRRARLDANARQRIAEIAAEVVVDWMTESPAGEALRYATDRLTERWSDADDSLLPGAPSEVQPCSWCLDARAGAVAPLPHRCPNDAAPWPTEPADGCLHVDTDAGGNCRNPLCGYNSDWSLPRLTAGGHYETDCPSGKSCDECVIVDGSMKGLTYGQLNRMMADMAAAGCANCGSSHDHSAHPERCCDETCP